MSSTLLLSVYCLAIAGISVVGGLLPDRVTFTHTRTQVIMSLVAGLMLGVALYHLLPHSVVMAGGQDAVDDAVWWLMAGLICMFLLLRMFHFHQHDFSTEEDRHHEHAHHHHDGVSAHRLSWAGVALGLAVHTVIDGVALGAVMRGDYGHHAGLLGIGVFLAIFLHKPLDAMSITALMNAGGWDRGARRTVNLVFAAMCPLGALLFFFGVDLLGEGRDQAVAAALAFSAGAFVCIALSDLLPEVQFHSHDRTKLTAAFLVGIVLAYGIGGLEPAGLH
jgi:zinc and cadmium transporter